MTKEEERKLITTIAGCSFMMLMMVVTLIYAVTHRNPGISDMVIVLNVLMMLFVSANIIGGPVAYYKEKFKELKQKK